MADYIKFDDKIVNADEVVYSEIISDKLFMNLGPGGQLQKLDRQIKAAPGTGYEGIINAATTVVNAITAVEYNVDVINQVISNLESLAGTSVYSAELLTSNVGEAANKIEEYFKLYNEIHMSLHETVKNILKTVTEVWDEAASM